jgi:hypothetical protein
MNKLYLSFICMFFLLLSLSLVSASNIIEQKTPFVEQGKGFILEQFCSNSTYANISSIKMSSLNLLSETAMIQVSNDYYQYNFTNTNLTGTYSAVYHCNENGIDVGGKTDFTVTPNGQEATSGSAFFYIGLLAVLVIFLILCINAFVKFDNLLARVGMLGLSYLLLIAITFVSWNMASDFITSSPFLIDMLRILFWVLMAGAFPLLIGGFVWYLLLLFKIKEIQRLMDKGFSEDEAERRTGRRK